VIIRLHLLWYATDKYPRADKPRPTSYHDREYAPSWSWAAVIGRKTFAWKENYSFSELDRLTPKIEILELNVEPENPMLNPYGAVKSGGYLRARGFLCPGRAKYWPGYNGPEYCRWTPSVNTELSSVEIQPDVPDTFRQQAADPNSMFYLLPICAQFEDKNPVFGAVDPTGFTKTHGLVLAKESADNDDEDGPYRRVGYFEFEPGAMYGWVLEWAFWEDLGTEKDIRIV